jgi:hypothetical protein
MAFSIGEVRRTRFRVRRITGDGVMKMKRTLLAAAMLFAGAAASAAELTLFGRDNFAGKRNDYPYNGGPNWGGRK